MDTSAGFKEKGQSASVAFFPGVKCFFPSRNFSILVDPKQISVVLVSKSKKKKTKKKKKKTKTKTKTKAKRKIKTKVLCHPSASYVTGVIWPTCLLAFFWGGGWEQYFMGPCQQLLTLKSATDKYGLYIIKKKGHTFYYYFCRYYRYHYKNATYFPHIHIMSILPLW